MHSGFAGIVGANPPVGIERVLHAQSRVQGVRSVIVRIDQRGVRRPLLQTVGIDGLERRDPSVLGQIVEVQSYSSAEYRLLRVTEGLRGAQPRGESFPIITRNPVHQSCAQGGIGNLAATRRNEK